MKRREVLKTAAAATAALGASGLLAHQIYLAATGVEESAESARLRQSLRERFRHLRIDDAVITEFLLAREELEMRFKGREYELPPFDVFEQFLLSTDFFENGADESRELHFVALYHPYSAPCRNPFTRRGA